MASEKVYGRDGPPQLRGRVEDIPLEDVPKFWGEEGLRNWHLSVPEWWGKRIRCTCGATDAFEVFTVPVTAGEDAYCSQRCDLRCTRCGDRFLLFDGNLHGWNAVIADERAALPPDYLESNAKYLQQLVCGCGGRVFSVIAEAAYDCGEGIEDIPESQWDEAYGWFNATARCCGCGELHEAANKETA